MGKESACSAGNLGSVPGEGHGYTLQYSCLENPVDRRAYSPYSCKQLDMAEAAERTQHSLVQSSLHTCRQGRLLRGLAICAATRRCGAWRSVPLPGAAGPGDLCRYQALSPPGCGPPHSPNYFPKEFSQTCELKLFSNHRHY